MTEPIKTLDIPLGGSVSPVDALALLIEDREGLRMISERRLQLDALRQAFIFRHLWSIAVAQTRRRRQRKGRRYRPPPAYSRMARSERFTTAIVAWKSYKRPGLCNFQASESWVELGTILRFHFTNGFATSLL